jgi:hypothetical protein
MIIGPVPHEGIVNEWIGFNENTLPSKTFMEKASIGLCSSIVGTQFDIGPGRAPFNKLFRKESVERLVFVIERSSIVLLLLKEFGKVGTFSTNIGRNRSLSWLGRIMSPDSVAFRAPPLKRFGGSVHWDHVVVCRRRGL